MIKIISPAQFKQIPWKNGQGQTTELAISPKGTLANFDWRISMAKVSEDGAFSDFSGYLRNLILIKGNGITLKHMQNNKVDVLDQLLCVATFNGASQTIGKLLSGLIVDFNLITKHKKYDVDVTTYRQQQTVYLPNKQLCFVYCIGTKVATLPQGQELPPLHLLQVFTKPDQNLSITGEEMIVMSLNPKEK